MTDLSNQRLKKKNQKDCRTLPHFTGSNIYHISNFLFPRFTKSTKGTNNLDIGELMEIIQKHT